MQTKFQTLWKYLLEVLLLCASRALNAWSESTRSFNKYEIKKILKIACAKSICQTVKLADVKS